MGEDAAGLFRIFPVTDQMEDYFDHNKQTVQCQSHISEVVIKYF